MMGSKCLLRTRAGFIISGLLIGFSAVMLQKFGNPANMGICITCFIRDTAGALGLHRAAAVQYIRPELIGLLLGSFITSMIFREFRPRSGSASTVKFTLGFFAMIGTLVFLGCPWRMIIRLAGGDLNAIIGFTGLVTGIRAGIYFRQSGYDPGNGIKDRQLTGLIIPVSALLLILLLIVKPELPSGVPFESTSGPGAMHAPLYASIGFGLLIGFVAQRTRFCTIGAIRSVFFREFDLLFMLLSFLSGAFILNLLFGQVNPGFSGQPVAHSDHIWSFGGMLLAGLAFVLGGGCPGRQLILSGEGDGSAAVFVFGMFAGAAAVHNFPIASTPGGTASWGPAAVIIGIVVCIIIGSSNRNVKN